MDGLAGSQPDASFEMKVDDNVRGVRDVLSSLHQAPPTPVSHVSGESGSEKAGSNQGDSSSENHVVEGDVTSQNDIVGEDVDAEAEEEEEEEPQVLLPKQRVYRERIKRIHLPIREGMEDLSDDEGDGSEWALPPLNKPVPPGYDGKRRVRPEGEKVRPDGKVKPSYYYPTEGSSRGVPVFEPTIEEYKDFNSFINKIDNYGMRSGIVKIVPPKEWADSLHSVSQPLKDTLIKDAIEQNFMGSQGLFRQSNIASRRMYNVKQWKEMCDSDKYQTPNFFSVPEEEKVNTKQPKRGRRSTATATTPRTTRSSRATPASATPASASAARRGASPTPSVANSEQQNSNDIDGEGENVDVDFEKLQDPDEAEEWETKLKEQSKAEQARKEAAQQQAEQEGSETKKEDDEGTMMNSTVIGAQAPPSPANSNEEAAAAVKNEDSAMPAVERATAETPVQESPVQTPVPSTSVPQMPWQPTQWPLPTSAQSNPGLSISVAKSKQENKQFVEPTTPVSATGSKPANKKRPREEATEQWEKDWENFDYTSLPYGAKPSDFTVEECKQIEKMYWRRFTFGSPPMYGADGSGSLFDESTKDWNVAALDDLLMRINPHMPMPGVNTPYLYFGMWRATFSWHVEDADLYSINYIHFGSPKFWYSVPQEHAERFERVLAGYFPRDRQRCPEFLRHKSFLVSPTNLAKDGIPLNRVVQLPGEIILTYPYGYHSGFNLGFNCAESINFATEGWLDIGRRARACVCLPDTVRIDVDSWLEQAREDAERIRSDPAYAEQRKQERELAVVIPQHEARRKRELGAAYEERKARAPPAPRMQAVRPANTGAPRTQRVKPSNASHAAAAPVQTTATGKKAAATSLTAQFAAAQAKNANKPVIKGYYPCALCPEQITEGLVKIAPPSNAGNKRNMKPLYAHRICVTFTPTTWCAPDPNTGEESVYGFDLIEKERWALKCGLCTDRHGTKIQCTKSAKCVRAFHATCAIKEESGVLLDALIGGKSVLEAPKEGEDLNFSDGHLQLAVTCRQHNPVWVRAQNEKKRLELARKVMSIPPRSEIQIRTTTGVYSVTVLAHREDQGAVEIMFGDGTRALCKHGAIVWPDEAAKMLAQSQNLQHIIGSTQPPSMPQAQYAQAGQSAPLVAQTQYQPAQYQAPMPPVQHAPFHPGPSQSPPIAPMQQTQQYPQQVVPQQGPPLQMAPMQMNSTQVQMQMPASMPTMAPAFTALPFSPELNPGFIPYARTEKTPKAPKPAKPTKARPKKAVAEPSSIPVPPPAKMTARQRAAYDNQQAARQASQASQQAYYPPMPPQAPIQYQHGRQNPPYYQNGGF